MVYWLLWRSRDIWTALEMLKKQRKRRKLEQQQMAEASEAESVSYVAPLATTEVISVSDNGIVIKRRLM